MNMTKYMIMFGVFEIGENVIGVVDDENRQEV
jgi:hypothetical protein